MKWRRLKATLYKNMRNSDTTNYNIVMELEVRSELGSFIINLGDTDYKQQTLFM